MAETPSLEDALRVLRERFAANLPSRLDEIDRLWGTVRGMESVDDNARELLRHVHSLAGSGASFGYEAVSEKARDLELFFTPFVNNAQAMMPTDTTEFERLADRLRDAIKQVAGAGQVSPQG